MRKREKKRDEEGERRRGTETKEGRKPKQARRRGRKETRTKTEKAEEKPRSEQDETRDKQSTEATKTQNKQNIGQEKTRHKRQRERLHLRRHHGVIQALASMLLGPRSSVLGVSRVGRRPRRLRVAERETCGERDSSNEQKRWIFRNQTGVEPWKRQRVQ